MPYDPQTHHRRSLRLRGYDYADYGAYFFTTVVRDRACILGQVLNEAMVISPLGRIVREAWDDLPAHYPHVGLDEFVVMPNHVHGILWLLDTSHGSAVPGVGAGLKPAPTAVRCHALPEVIRAFKTFSARRINEKRATPGAVVWQRNYFEHLIRDERSLEAIRQYILSNPLCWGNDAENPARQQ